VASAPPPPDAFDAVVVGGGPAGLTAAIYLARFRLSVRVFDAGVGRAAIIPRTRNHAGFPDGISGAELLGRMRDQALRYGAQIEHARVERLERAPDGRFSVATAAGEIRAGAVILATGVTNRRPPMPDELHAAAVAAGRIRYCPICDGFEVIGQAVAVIGTGEHGLREAQFLRAYTPRVTLIAPSGPHTLDDDQRRRLAALGITPVDGPAEAFALDQAGLALTCAAGRLSFEAVYPALGSIVHSDLARALGADLEPAGCIKVDAHQRASTPGLYAAGDVVIGLDQISHAMGEGGVAATTLRNDLTAARPLLAGDLSL